MALLLFNIYLGACNMLLIEICKFVSRNDEKDIFKAMDEVYQSGEELKKITGFDANKFIDNLINFAQNNPLLFYVIIFLFVSLPIINIITFISYIINIIKTIKKNR